MKNILLVVAVAAAATPASRADATGNRAPLTAAGFMAPRQITTAPNLTVDLEQVYRNNRWKDTLRTTNSRFNNPVTLPGGRVVPAQPVRILREQSANGTTWSPTRRRHRLYNAANAANAVVNDTSYSFNATTGVATPRLMSATTYNAAGDIAQMVSSLNLGGNWQNSERDTYTYSARGRLVRILVESGTFPNSFYDSSQTLFTYNTQNQPISTEVQRAYSSDFGWLFFHKKLYTYDAQGRVATNVGRIAPTNSNTYLNFSRETYSYDAANGGRIQSTVVDGWNNGAWTVAAAALRYELPVAVAVFDLAGRTMASVFAAVQTAGTHTLTLPALPAAGLYVVRLTAGN